MRDISFLMVEILSEATFASGHMSALEVDTDTVCDEDGIPYIPARTLKGLLVEEASGILRAI